LCPSPLLKHYRNPHADEEAPRCGAAPGAPTGQPGAQPAAAPDRACQQQRQALSDCERPDPPVEGGRPRSGDGALLCPAQFPGAPEPLAAHDLIGINSIIGVDCDGLSVLLPLEPFPAMVKGESEGGSDGSGDSFTG